jgi:L-Ala-D/L-Glu epimerase
MALSIACAAKRCTVERVRITRVHIEPWNVELLEPFGIATGAQLTAENVLVELVLESGHTGLGEAAPFPAVNGETQADALAALHAVVGDLVGCAKADAQRLLSEPHARLEAAPSALAALEMALLDAHCRQHELSMFRHFGGARADLLTDITIPTGGPEAAARAAQRAIDQGFQTLKVKVGGVAFDDDLRRLRAIAEAAPTARLLLDANASLSAEHAIELVEGLGERRSQVVLFEQPCVHGDYAGSRRVREAGLRVAADEDARTLDDVQRLWDERAADVINFKLTKSGLTRSVRMIALARRLGLGLMMGGMVETRLAMTVSACIAGGIGGFEELDLDTPLFMKDERLEGGFVQQGPQLFLAPSLRGHGVSRAARPDRESGAKR